MTDSRTLDQTPSSQQITLSDLAARWASLPRVNRELWGLALLRLLIALAIMLDVLPMPPEMRYGWYLHHGGDQELMLRLAQSIVAGSPVREVIGIGQSLVMIPWIVLLNPPTYFDLVAPLVVINGFLLAGLSVVVLGTTIKLLTGSERVAFWTAALWALAPFITYFAFFWHFDPLILRGSNVPKIGWLNGLSDAPATFFIMLAVLIVARMYASDQRPLMWQMIALGISLAVAVVFRVHIAPIVMFIIGYVLVVYGWRALLEVALGGLIGYLPQAWYNSIAFGLPLTTGYLSLYRTDFENPGGRPLSTILTTLPFHPRHIVELFDYYIGRRPWVLIPLVVVAALLILTTIAIWKRRGWKAVALLIGVPLSYLGVMSTAWPFRDDVIRFSIPAMPYLIAIVVYALWLGGQWLRGFRRETLSPAVTDH